MNPNDEKFIPRKLTIQGRRFKLISARELLADRTPTIWTVKDYLEAGTFATMIGPPKSGKTFLALDIGLCVAAGKDWHGRPVAKKLVIYICGEGKTGIGRRIDAFCRENNIAKENLPFFVSETAAQLTDNMSLAMVVAEIVEVMLKYGEPALIIIDTLNRNFGDGDENSTSDMNRFVAAVDQLRNNFSGCTALVIHHTGLKDAKRGRGSSALRGAIDFEYLVDRKKDVVTLECSEIKDHAKPPVRAFKTVVVDLGLLDEEGKPITSFALKLTETPRGSSRTGKILKGANKVAFEALQSVSEMSGQASEEEWRTEAYSREISPSKNPATKQKAFRRAKDNLLESGLIKAEGDYFFIVGKETGQTGQ